MSEAPRASSGARHVVDPLRIEKYLAERWPQRSGLRVERVRRIVGGMSRRTHFVDVAWTSDDGSPEITTLNFRSDHAGLTVFTVPLWWEFEVLRRLHGTEIPVARPLWYEDDPQIMGFAPFYLREVVPGSAQSKPLFTPGSEQRRLELGRQVVTLLARVHTLDWAELGFGEFMSVPDSPAACATHELDHWEGFYREHAVEPRPMVHEVFGRLRQNPPSSDRISLLWGDVGIGQFIYEDDRVTALTDFEMSRLGDPMMDWAAALTRGLDHLIPRDEAFEIYERESGIAIDLERIDYCTLVAAASCFCWHPLLRDLSGGVPQDAALTRLGVGLTWQWLDITNRLLATHL